MKTSLLSKTIFSKDDLDIREFAAALIHESCLEALKAAGQRSENTGLDAQRLHTKIARLMGLSIDDFTRFLSPTVHKFPSLSSLARFAAACGNNMQIKIGKVSKEFYRPGAGKLQQLIRDARKAAGLTEEEIAERILWNKKDYKFFETAPLIGEIDFLTFLRISLALGDVPKMTLVEPLMGRVLRIRQASLLPKGNIDLHVRRISLSLVRQFNHAAMEGIERDGQSPEDIAALMNLSIGRLNNVLSPKINKIPSMPMMVRLAATRRGSMEIMVGIQSTELTNPDEVTEKIWGDLPHDRRNVSFLTFIQTCLRIGHEPKLQFNPGAAMPGN